MDSGVALTHWEKNEVLIKREIELVPYILQVFEKIIQKALDLLELKSLLPVTERELRRTS